jgi:hypothetical protein
VKRRYPLESLRLAKQRDKDASSVATRSAAELRQRAEQIAERARAERARDAHELNLSLAAEDARIDAGTARAADLARGESHRSEAEEHLRSRAAAERRAERLLGEARHSENEALDALSRARGAERAVEEHRARFAAVEFKESERRDEEDAGDSWNGARRGKSPRR